MLFDINDMNEFIIKVNNFLNSKDKNIEMSSEPKIDGISATLVYEKRSSQKRPLKR